MSNLDIPLTKWLRDRNITKGRVAKAINMRQSSFSRKLTNYNGLSFNLKELSDISKFLKIKIVISGEKIFIYEKLNAFNTSSKKQKGSI